jgi:hypothetical protein
MRLNNIILTDLTNDKLKSLERLERAMNSKKDLDNECNTIKHELRELALIDHMVDMWNVINIPDSGIFEQPRKKDDKNE